MSYSECVERKAPSLVRTHGQESAEATHFWLIIGAMTAVAALGLYLSNMKVSLGFPIIFGFLVLVGLNLFYTRVRKNPLFASVALTCAQLVAFTNVAIVLSYLAAARRFALVDNTLAAMDAAVSFNWLALFAWLKIEHPTVGWTLDLIYDTMITQVFILLIVLCSTKRLLQARTFSWLFAVTLLIVIPISMVLPAEGAWAHYGVAHLTSAYYLPDFYAIRSGSMHVIDLDKATGIIQFPSFHAALALILILSSRGTVLFPVYLPLNVLMIISALTAGGHYLMDVAFGLATVPAAVLALRLTGHTSYPRTQIP
ncbi:phosphatase PAP2 family protein [Bradyrhizobium tropiciagri]|uniref:phosphatase PAP2 family protein n=1 Tax=Bradyrhizobium tropiciagri TaxID=312253 RepID=UPI000AD0E632|nr:phosphatase PAP2 family protein [Bradyrhizobium tropiciagri]